jgi:CRP-like cAMP-binding protein
LVQLDEAKFMYMVGQTPYFALDVLRVMANRLRHTTEAVTRISGRLQKVMRSEVVS